MDTLRLRLKPSPIHGVGVFATAVFRKGQVIPLFHLDDWRWIAAVNYIESRYCTHAKGGGFYRPKYWNRMSIGWYLNHSSSPNVCAKTWKALKYIQPGQELTIDYSKLEVE